MRDIRVTTLVAGALCAATAVAQPTFQLEAFARSVGSPDVTDRNATDFATAQNFAGGSTEFNSFIHETFAEGGPDAAVVGARAGASAEMGTSSSSGGFAKLTALRDTIRFNASGPFRIRVTADFRHSVSTASQIDGATIDFNGDFFVRPAGSSQSQRQTFRYREVIDGNGQRIEANALGPFEFDLEPGDDFYLSNFTLTAFANARANADIGNGRGDSNAEVYFTIETVSGDGVLVSSDSGADYGPAPCSPADLAEPFGVISQADVAAFVDLFFAGDPKAAAFAEPLDVASQADVSAFVDLFFAGCPAN
ncbi:MAG: hypothetical protein AAFR38_10085 [Planctomycetota bacterium]